MPPGQIDAALLQQIRERTPLADLIGRKVPLRRSGGTHVGCCPFHGEKTPSLHVYQDHFKCFGCGVHGDAFSFVQKLNRTSFPEAVRELAQQAGVEIPGAARPLTAAERERREQQNAAAKEREAALQRRLETERQADHAAIRRMANKIWDRAGPADPNHPYLLAKGLAGDVEGLRQDKWGNLLVPRREIGDWLDPEHGQVWNIERILPEKTGSGKNKFTLWRKVDGSTRGGRVDGVFTVFGDLKSSGPLAISTGTATAKSVRRITGWTTVGVGPDSNLLAVAETIRKVFPERELIIAGDNDIRLESRVSALGVPMENQGRIKAEAAARAVGAVAAIPPFPVGAPDSDWNDHERIHGAAAAGALLEAARASLHSKLEIAPMPDAAGPVDIVEAKQRAPEQVAPQQPASPPAPAEPGSWREAVEKLQAVRGDAEFQQASPELARRTEKLLADLGQDADLQDEKIRTRIAYLVSDIDRTTGASLPLSAELRSEVDRLAVSYPGLDHPEIQSLLRQTHALEAGDLQTVTDVRVLARDYVDRNPASDASGEDSALAERIRTMEDRVRAAVAGSDPPPHEEVPSHHADAAGEQPTPEATATTRPATPQASQRPANQAQAQQGGRQPPPQQVPPQQAQQQQAAQQAGTVNIPMTAASRLLDRLTRGRGDGPPPWQGPTQALSERLASYEQAQADRHHRDLERSAETSGRAAIKALAALDTGPAAEVMRKIGREAASDPNGATGVIEQMRPGGKHETLRNELNAVFAQDKNFGPLYDRAKAATANYLESRNALEENYHRRGWRVADLDEKLKDTDRAIADVAERTPGRESGRSLSEELAKKAVELAEALYEKVRLMFSKMASEVSPGARQAASSSPSVSPSP